jgi:hypothetical protein
MVTEMAGGRNVNAHLDPTIKRPETKRGRQLERYQISRI